MAITLSLIRDHHGRKQPNEEAPIEIRLIYQRKVFYLNTGIKTKANEFVGGSVVNRIDAPELNKRLEILFVKTNREVNAILESGGELKMADIRRRVWNGSESDELDFIDWAKQYLESSDKATGTISHCITVLNRVESSNIIKKWSDISVEAIYKFDEYLHGLRSPRLSMSTIYNHHKHLKALLYRAERVGKIDRNPYSRLHGEFDRGNRDNIEYLTEDEMQCIVNFSPLPGSLMAKARDLFIFQMYTGLSYSDAQGFDISKYKLVDGKWISTQPRVKTGVPYVSVLLPPVVEVLERNDWDVPSLSNQEYNRLLKQIGSAIGISIPMHSHLARHTFATYMLRNGVKIENLARMLGHTNITQTQRYAKVLALSVQEDFDKISSLLEGRKTLASGELESSEK